MAGATVQWLRDSLGLIATAAESEALAQPRRPEFGRLPRAGLSGARRPALGRRRASRDPWPDAAPPPRPTSSRRGSRRSPSRPAICSTPCGGHGGERHLPLRQPAGRWRHDREWLVPAAACRHPGRAGRGRAQAETTALGAAYLAGQAAGLYGSQEELQRAWVPARAFEPRMRADERDARYGGWLDAVAKVRSNA